MAHHRRKPAWLTFAFPDSSGSPLCMDPDLLADLAQSPMGFDAGDPLLRELCWAVQAHCAARQAAGRWDCIEVPRMLDCWAQSYSSQDLSRLLILWVRLLAWMGELGLLPWSLRVHYAHETELWLRAWVRLLGEFRELLPRVSNLAEGRRGEHAVRGSDFRKK